MSLASHERRVLAAVEKSLRSTDPALVAMLEMFGAPSPGPPRARINVPGRRIKVPVVVALILADKNWVLPFMRKQGAATLPSRTEVR